MKLRALDSVHVSDVGMLHAGTEFECSDARGAELIDRKLAVEIKSTKKAVEAEDEDEPEPAAPAPVSRATVPAARSRK